MRQSFDCRRRGPTAQPSARLLGMFVGTQESKNMTQQLIVTDVKLAALLSYLGYEFRVTKDTLGTQFLFSHSGDIGEAVQAFEQNAQVSSAKTLLEVYDEFLEQLKGDKQTALPTGQAELLPAEHRTDEDRTWVTSDTTTSVLLHYANYRLLRTKIEKGSVDFIFAWDDQLTDVVKKFNKNEWLVSPKKWTEAAFVIRDLVRRAKGY
jgi:hypothetical protein